MFSFMMNASIGDIQENGKADLWSGKKKRLQQITRKQKTREPTKTEIPFASKNNNNNNYKK